VDRCRVVQITQDLGYGGLERVAATICRHVDRDRFEMSVLCLREAGPLADELRDEGFQVDVLPGDRGGADYFSGFRVAKFLRERRPDVVHTHNTQALLDGAVGTLAARTPTLIHTDHARQFPDKRRYIIAEHLLSRLTYRTVGVSEHTTENLRRHIRIPEGKLITVANGIDIPALDRATVGWEVRRELGIDDGDIVIGSAVRLAQQKGLQYLIRAFSAVLARFPRALLVIAGKGEEREALEALAASTGVAHRVRFLGARGDVPRLLCAFDVLALPSLWEGMPLGILEAMALGCPIVATSVGGVPEVIEHPKSGVLVPPRSVADLESALVGLLDDPGLASMLADNAYARYQERFSLHLMVEAYEKLYLRWAHEVARPGRTAGNPAGVVRV
jgi:glycosyltransferase involved in cell wall biosynthesis